MKTLKAILSLGKSLKPEPEKLSRKDRVKRIYDNALHTITTAEERMSF
jgi:hypothetical protein